MQTRFFVGVDLGQRHDPTALAMVAREEHVTNEIDAATRERVVDVRYLVGGVRRLKLGTPYTEQVEEIARIVVALPPEGQAAVVVDATGVGAPVVELLRQQLGSRPLVPVIFTGGDTARYDAGFWRVPKKDLVHGVMVLLQQGQLRISGKSPHAPLLIQELTSMRLRITPEGNAGYAAWREGEHDDLVFALALACWRARRTERRPLGERRPLFW